ncbi:MAG: MBL fold metallo-hydrolase [Candidatus Babeliaceae bacterium]|jgi:ribonuclease BN (tRNA processing enzyme)
MNITFLGTRGYIKSRTQRHYRHTSTLISHNDHHIMIDCGIDWAEKVCDIKPDAIIITHAHPDHAWGLKHGSPCPVYATQESWHIMQQFEIPQVLRHIITPRTSYTLHNVIIEAFSVVHSIRAPAVGYRITIGTTTIFCVHDIVYIEQRAEALTGVSLYIGDGASLTHPIIRKKDGMLFGHSPISTQLTWCRKEGVPQAIFTHCGTRIVESDAREVNKKLQELAKKRGVQASIAYDGLQLSID